MVNPATGKMVKGGQFTVTEQATADVEGLSAIEPSWEEVRAGLDTDDPDELAEAFASLPRGAREAAIRKAMPEWFTSVYLDHDANFDHADREQDEAIDAYLAGDHIPLSDIVEEYTFDVRQRGLDEGVEEVVETLGLDPDTVDVGSFDEIRWELENLDDSDPVRDYISNTKPLLMRQPLVGGGQGDLNDGLGNASLGNSCERDESLWKVREDRVRDLCRRNGVKISDDDISALVANGPWDWHEGVTLDLVWSGGIDDASNRHGDEGEEVTLASPHLLLNDPVGGSGFDVAVDGPVRTRFSPERPARLDRNTRGYSWDDTCGLHIPAYASEVVRPGPRELEARAVGRVVATQLWGSKVGDEQARRLGDEIVRNVLTDPQIGQFLSNDHNTVGGIAITPQVRKAVEAAIIDWVETDPSRADRAEALLSDGESLDAMAEHAVRAARNGAGMSRQGGAR